MNFNNQHRFSLNVLIAKIKGFWWQVAQCRQIKFFRTNIRHVHSQLHITSRVNTHNSYNPNV